MSPTNEFYGRWRMWPTSVVACLGAAVLLLASCGGSHSVKAAGPAEAPTVSVVVAPVVQKTVSLFTELTARTDATDTVEIAEGEIIFADPELHGRHDGESRAGAVHSWIT